MSLAISAADIAKDSWQGDTWKLEKSSFLAIVVKAKLCCGL